MCRAVLSHNIFFVFMLQYKLTAVKKEDVENEPVPEEKTTPKKKGKKGFCWLKFIALL